MKTDIDLLKSRLPVEPGWEKFGACGDSDPDIMLIENDPVNSPRARAARRICTDCKVAESCLNDALVNGLNDNEDGVRGGLAARQRKSYTKKLLRQIIAEQIALPETAASNVLELSEQAEAVTEIDTQMFQVMTREMASTSPA